jgi:ankyrin repeat protein
LVLCPARVRIKPSPFFSLDMVTPSQRDALNQLAAPPADASLDEQLVHSARCGQAERLRQLIDLGANPLAQSPLGEIGLHLAARRGHVDALKVLLPFGGLGHAAPNHFAGGRQTPLMAAASSGNLDCLRLLLPGSDLTRANDFGHCALALACAGGHAECALALLEAGAQPDRVHLDQTTALGLAMARESVETLAVLLPWSNPDLFDDDGETPLMQALRFGLPEHTRLLALASNLDAVNDQGVGVLALRDQLSPSAATAVFDAVIASRAQARELSDAAGPARSKPQPRRM